MTPPGFELYDHQSQLSLDLERLTRLAEAAWQRVIVAPGPEEPALPGLAVVEVSFISDEAISQVHAEFLDDATPTDVITFAHGEILISTDTAVRQAVEQGQTPEHEVSLYLIHGLLHLNGHEDHTEEGFARMRQLQEAILQEVF